MLFGQVWASSFTAKLAQPGNQEKRKLSQPGNIPFAKIVFFYFGPTIGKGSVLWPTSNLHTRKKILHIFFFSYSYSVLIWANFWVREWNVNKSVESYACCKPHGRGAPIFKNMLCKALKTPLFSSFLTQRPLKIMLCHPKVPCFAGFWSKVTNLSPKDPIFWKWHICFKNKIFFTNMWFLNLKKKYN